MDWILDEVLVNLKDTHKAIEKRITTYSEYEDEFRGPLATDNKFEAAKHEYWRGRWLEAATNCEEIEELIKNDIISEEELLTIWDEVDEGLYDNKGE